MVPLISVGWYRYYPTDIHAVKGDKGAMRMLSQGTQVSAFKQSRKSTCNFEDMGRYPAKHHKSQGFFSTYIEIMVAIQMGQIQTKD